MKNMKRYILIFFLLNVLVYSGNLKKEIVFFDFEEKSELWKISQFKNNGVKKVEISEEKSLSGKSSQKIYVEFPSTGCIEKPFFKDLSKYRNIFINVYVDKKAPEDLKILIFLQDAEWLWYQTQLFKIKGGKWNKITVDVRPESSFWENVGHNQPWSYKSLSNIKKIGIKIFSKTNWKGEIYIDRIGGEIYPFPNYSISSKKVEKYGKVEINFYLPKNYKNPFDPDVVCVDGIFIDPDGEKITVPGFYYQKYSRELIDGEEFLKPSGYPYWKVRFTPTKCGEYKFYIKVKDDEGEKISRKGKFLVVPSSRKGFIRVSKIDPRYFEFSEGHNFFYPIGLNIRSPTDVRYAIIRGRRLPPDEGTFYYEKMFKKMHENGENFTEIWMASWFTALEWIENRPGYKGVGYYNLRNAWKLDKIVELAEKYGIYLQIVIINHGQLSTFCDAEWRYNPYNKRNKGFLNSPEEFFTNKLAKEYTKKKLRYIVGRWSYSPNIFSWVLINEINLIGSRRKFYKKPTVGMWYEEIGNYLKKIDPYKHLLSCHYTILIDNELLRSPVIDYTITNAYYTPKKRTLIEVEKTIYDFNSRFGKPTFISEYGGTPWASNKENLKRDIVVGLWGCFHLPFAGTPLFWWHRFVNEFNLHHYYKVLSEFSSNIDRIRMELNKEKVELKGKGSTQLQYMAIGNKYFTSCWICDNRVLGNLKGKRKFTLFSGIKVVLKDKIPGNYILSFWDMEKGLIDEKVEKFDGKYIEFSLPPFRKWIAFKMRLKE
ncbi:MAG: hypothetical protein DRP67_01985 [Candidatus Omnitrophota bacterium]|nr:MAG: hypothetical protein DRP67_01985 [Candidatus Omnitrophota bacterium]